MEFWLTVLVLLALGCLGGFISGLLGIGGGIIFIPILSWFMEKEMLSSNDAVRFVVANSLFAVIFSGLSISIKQYRIGNFFPKEVLYTALPGIVSSLLMSHLIRNYDWYDERLFVIIFSILLIPFVVRMVFFSSKTEISPDTPSTWKLGLTGFFTGIITSMSGLGGGVIMIPFFTNLLKMDIRKATSISAGVIILFALPVSISYLVASAPVLNRFSPWQTGFIIYPLILPLIIGVMLLAPYGVRINQRTAPRTLGIIFGIFASIILSRMIYKLF